MRQRNKEIKLAIVTGDLTQRAKKKEFLAAKEFITSLNAPLFVVPGNHDVPLYNVFLRFLSPYKKFLKYMGPFAQNYYEDEHVAVYGLWTVDKFAVQTGRIRESDLKELEEKFRAVPAEKIKIIACHHPLPSINHPKMKDRLKRIVDLSPHFMMWGHEHQSSVSFLHGENSIPLILASGTTTSERTRSEANSFNLLSFDGNSVKIEVYRHSKLLKAFEAIDTKTFPLTSAKSFSY